MSIVDCIFAFATRCYTTYAGSWQNFILNPLERLYVHLFGLHSQTGYGFDVLFKIKTNNHYTCGNLVALQICAMGRFQRLIGNMLHVSKPSSSRIVRNVLMTV